jgi:NodT family efflux transporter outer membrane factor (OMF) lipoprotein
MKSTLRLLLLSIAGCSFGCGVLPSVGPDYKGPPQVKLPESWQSSADSAPKLSDATKNWWQVLEDESLNKLVCKAVERNRQLDLARSRVREVKEAKNVAFAGFFPQIGAGFGITRNKISQNVLLGRLFQEGGPRNLQLAQTTYDVGLDASWEVDVLGGQRRQYEAAEAGVSAAEEQLNDLMVILTSEVARSYYEVLALEKRLTIAKENISIQEESLEIVQSRVNAGLASELDLAQAKVQVENTRSVLPTLESLTVAARSRLAVLLGESIQELESDFPREAFASRRLLVKDLPAGVLQGVPSDILRNRPDIRAAERGIAAETARVGVAMAELFPKFSLTGSLRLQSINSQNFLDAASNAFNIGPSISLPIFTAGRLTALVRAQSERASQAVNQYEQIVLEALAEAESSLAAFEQEKKRYETLKNALAASKQSLALSKELYQKGLADFLRVIEAQRSVFAAEELLAISEQQMVSSMIASYKALGYGWVS